MKYLKLQLVIVTDTLIFFCVFILLSCTKEIQLEEVANPALSIYPVLEADKEIKIYAMPVKSIPDTISYTLSGGKGFVFVNNVCRDTVILSEKGQGTSKVTARAGESYTIKVKADGFPDAELTAAIPFPVTMLKVDTIRHYGVGHHHVMWQIDICFKINRNIKEYYRISISEKDIYYDYSKYNYRTSIYLMTHMIFSDNPLIDYYLYADTRLYLSKEPLGLLESASRKNSLGGIDGYMQGGNFFLTNNLVQSDSLTFTVFTNRLVDLDYRKIKYIIEVATLSPDYYKALYSYAKYYTNKEQDLPVTEPVMIYSHVKNGFGYAAALATPVDSSISSKQYKEYYNQ